MSSGTSGSDEKISGSKIDPLASDIKANVPHDTSSRGVAGSDRNIDQARIDPIGGKGMPSAIYLSLFKIIFSLFLFLSFQLLFVRIPLAPPPTPHSRGISKCVLLTWCPNGAGQYQHPAPHATAGVIGNDANIDRSKIEPLEEQADAGKGHAKNAGLGDEEVDAARVQPLGEVREQIV